MESSSDERRGKILLQRRTKNRERVDYFGLWELPQGKIRAGEYLFDAAKRELKEEAGLEILEISGAHDHQHMKILSSSIDVVKTSLCVIDNEHNYFAFPLVVRILGSPLPTHEASEHIWVSKGEVTNLINSNLVFPLNVPIILDYFGEGE